jgi:ubiquinol-cytochrome c reductase cytochrome c subunit
VSRAIGSTRGRQNRVLTYLGTAGIFAVAGVALVSTAATDHARGAAPVARQLGTTQGRLLFEERCSTCHGDAGEGTVQGPPITGLGPAVYDFQLSTGRMPLTQPFDQAVRKPSPFTPEQIGALVAYLSSLPPGGGIPIPAARPEAGDLADGQELYQLDCAPCHGASGNGGSVGGDVAPGLGRASPVEIAEAVWIGPGTMPVFREAFSEAELNSLVRYALFLRNQPDPGGASLGHSGPIVEGFLALLLGLGAAVVMARVIGTRS